jgi:hypothetical protein
MSLGMHQITVPPAIRSLTNLRHLLAKAAEHCEARKIEGIEYVQRFVLPNVYFHTTTTYDILRHDGVEIGKADFLGER